MSSQHSTAQARTILARSVRFERSLTSVFGVLALVTGLLALVAGAGWLGTHRAGRPLVDPLAVDWLAQYATPARIVAIVLGIVLLLLGVRWALRALRPEGRPNVRFDEDGSGELVVASQALTSAVHRDAETVTGVTRARVRLAGSPRRPTLRLHLSLRDGTEVREVWEELDTKVLARAREALGVERLPTAIHLDLDTSRGSRVE